MRGSVEFRGGQWRLDLAQNLGSLISNEIILTELSRFLAVCFENGGGALLDLGAGSRPYAPLYETYFTACTAVDVPHSPHDTTSVDAYASADHLPFDDAQFDCIICTEVMEHCRDPHAVMGEIARLLKPGGWAFVTTPFLLPLHEMPNDYYRYTPSALLDFADGANLTVDSIQSRGSYFAVALAVLLMPVGKLWQRTARLTRLPLYHPYNPLVYLTIVLPQQIYLASRRFVRQRPGSRVARLYEKLTYYTLGYVTRLQKPTE